MPEKEREKTLVYNRRARHEYFIEETYETGLELCGTEVKSLRMGKANLGDAYAEIKGAEVWVQSMHISPYEKGNVFNRDPLRSRKLLMHKREITKLIGLTQQKGYTLIPLRLYLKGSLVKLELGLARGKKLYDKRASAAERDARRDAARAMREDQRR
ncbi:MAG: SsrA-binding protein SmpB [Eubacteriales bacterium]|nr:SsrA-binding protein SmpB [Eubacteriales bacterium]